MTRLLVPVIALLLSAGAAAQPNLELDPVRVPDPSVLAGSPHPALLDDLVISGYDQLRASLSVENKGASLAWAPWIAGVDYGLLDETRFELSQKDGVTRFGVGLRYNPFAPRSRRGDGLWTAANAGLQGGAGSLIAQFGQVNFQVHLDSTDLVSELDSLAVLRGRLVAAPRGPDRENVRSEIERLEASVEQRHARLRTNRPARARLGKALVDSVAAVNLRFRESLTQYRGVVPGASATVALFPTLFGGNVDADGDGLDDTAYSVKEVSVALSSDVFPADGLQFSTVASYARRRTAAEDESPVNDVLGFGATLSGRVYIFDRDGYRASKAYRESLFVPGVTLGFATEFSACVSAQAECADGVERTVALTPFIDVRVQKQTQFRLGLSGVWKHRTVGDDGAVLEPQSLFSIQLGLPK